MQAPRLPENETERLALLHALDVLDHTPDPALDRITRTAARLFRVPIALITLVDSNRQWFMSRVGMKVRETPRNDSMCGHAILEPGTMVVCDAQQDPRFHDNPLVLGPPHIRFYAGRPLRSRHGLVLGTLCLIDREPRTFGPDDAAALDDLADMVEAHLRSREEAVEAQAVKASLERSEMLFARTVTHAAVGIAVATPEGRWLEMNQRFCDIVGHPRERLIGAQAQHIVHPDDLDAGTRLLRTVLAGDVDALNLEVRFVRADGSISWTQLGASALMDAQGQPENLVTVLTDINPRKRVQHELEALQRTLEQRIVERTGELHEVVARLQGEIGIREAAQRALNEEKERFQDTLRNASDAFVEVDADDRIISWNRSAELIFGWPRAEVIGRSLSQTIVPPHLRDAHLAGFRRFLAHAPDSGHLMGQRIELVGLRRNGEQFPLELTLGSTRVGGQWLINAFLHDISRRKADELALRESAARLKTITDNVPAMIAFIDHTLHYRFHNRAYTDWFGISPESLVGTDARAFWGEATFEHLRPSLQSVLSGESVAVEYQLQALTGPMWFYASLVPRTEDDGQVSGFYLLAQDITERKRLYQRIEHEAMHDALTGLPNRRALMQRLDEAMARSRRHGQPMAVLFMDLDGFKQMNDTLGHEFGDAVLQHFAATVRGAVRETDYVARLAGDEFVVVLEDLDPADEQSAGRVAAAVLERLVMDQEIEGVAVTLATSIGVALHSGRDEETPQELLHRADAAMYRAKALGKRQLAY
ncbi:PAS domain S-box protein [Dyella ginsengisoli]|uniref:PAS domain S-box protein n=1 Tax=Dyella ginsengisoli TaxID=363848 RepID=A0ABW8JWW9_9GAMM